MRQEPLQSRSLKIRRLSGQKARFKADPECDNATSELASSPGRHFKFRRNDGLVPIATMLVRMRWPLPEKHVIVYLACKPFRKPFRAKQWQNFMKRWPILFCV